MARAREARERGVRRQPVHGRVLALHEQRASPLLRLQLLEHGGGARDDQRVVRAHDEVGAREGGTVLARRLERVRLVRERDGGDRARVEVLEPGDHAEVVVEEAHVAVLPAAHEELADGLEREERARVQLDQLRRTPVRARHLRQLHAVPQHGVAVGGR